MKDKYEVFISSTHDDLIEERNKIKEVLLSMECIPRYMETFYASDISTWNFIKDILSGCDYYIIISAARYGSICEETGISFTQMEYEYAEKLNIPINRFLYKDPDLLPYYKHDKDIICQKKFVHFRELLQEGKIVKYWSNADELACSVAISIHHYIKADLERKYKRKESTISTNNDMIVNLKKIESIIKEISNDNFFLDAGKNYEDEQTAPSAQNISDDYQISNVAFDINYIVMDVLKEFANIVLSGGFNTLAYFFGVRIDMSLVKVRYFNNIRSLKKFILGDSKITISLDFNGYISGKIMLKFDKFYTGRMYNIIKRFYSVDLSEHDTTFCDTFLKELISMFVGSAMTNFVGFFNHNEPFYAMKMGTSFNGKLNDNTYLFELSSNKHNFLEFESFLLLDKNSVYKLWKIMKNNFSFL